MATFNHTELQLQKPFSQYNKYFIYMILIITTTLFVLVLFLKNIIVQDMFLLFFIFTLFLCIFITLITFLSDYFVFSLKNQQHPSNLDITSITHDALIIIHSMGSSSFGEYIGVDVIGKKCIENNYPFKIYHCYNPQEFLSIIENPYATYLWIFGHGWRGGITFKWKKKFSKLLSKRDVTTFSYAELLEYNRLYPQKEFIAQFHCNHFLKNKKFNLPLPLILLKKDFTQESYFVNNSKNDIISIWYECRKLATKLKRYSPLI